VGGGDVPIRGNRNLLFVLSETTEFGGLEKHFLDLLRRVKERQLHRLMGCFDQDIIGFLYSWIEGFPWQAPVAATPPRGKIQVKSCL